MERREFLTTLAALQIAAKLDAQTSNGMIYRNLGTTGERVSALGLGGYHMAVPRERKRKHSHRAQRRRSRHYVP